MGKIARSLALAAGLAASSLLYGVQRDATADPSSISAQWQATPDPMPTIRAVPNDDFQLVLSFPGRFRSLCTNVTATAQTDEDCFGPSYLLNGRTGNETWYQIGLAYNWPKSNSEVNKGFFIIASRFVVDPALVDGRIQNVARMADQYVFPVIVNNGDTVQLTMDIDGNNVILGERDVTIGNRLAVPFPSDGAQEFEGTVGLGDSFGFSTGVMTEWVHDIRRTNERRNEETVEYRPCSANYQHLVTLSASEQFISDYGRSQMGIKEQRVNIPPQGSQEAVINFHGLTAAYRSDGSFVTGQLPDGNISQSSSTPPPKRQ